MNDREHYSGAHLLMAFLGGAVAGVAIALLTAPQSGRETRETLKEWGREARDRAGRLPHAMREASSRGTHAAREAFADSMREHDREPSA